VIPLMPSQCFQTMAKNSCSLPIDTMGELGIQICLLQNGKT